MTDCVKYEPFLIQPGLAPVTGVPPHAPRTLDGIELSIRSNPVRSYADFRIQGPVNAAGRLEVLDTMGRRVWNQSIATKADGTCSLLWDLTGENGTELMPGLYLARVSLGAMQRTSRLLVVH